MAPLLRPIQKALLKNVRKIRPLQNALTGRDDPVFVSTCAGVCFLIAGLLFVWSELIHHHVAHYLAALKYAAVRAIGIALFGPQNFLLVRSKKAKKRAAQAREALILIDGRNRFAYLIQKTWRGVLCRVVAKAIVIQKYWRGCFTRKTARRQRVAAQAIVIQKYWRGAATRRRPRRALRAGARSVAAARSFRGL